MYKKILIGWEILVVACLLILGLPVLTGSLVRPAIGQFPGDRMHSIPDYWKLATNWLDSQPGNDRVLSMPRNGAVPDSYTWGYYGPPLLENYSRRPNVQAGLQGMVGYSVQERIYYNLAMSLYDSLDQGQLEKFRTMLDILNIGYIVNRSDLNPIINWGGTIPITTTNAINRLGSVRGVSFVKTFGELQIYKVDDVAPLIYASTLSQEDASKYCIVSQVKEIDFRACQLFLLPHGQDAKENPGEHISEPNLIHISFDNVNPTRYNVQVQAKESFWLNL